MLVYATLGAYIILLFGIAWYVGRNEGMQEYFLNARRSSSWLLALSHTATLVGAGATVAVVAEVSRTGISYALALVIAFLIGALIMAWLAPRIHALSSNGVYSIPDVIARFADRKTVLVATIVQLLLLLVWTAVGAVALGSLAAVLTDLPYALALLIIAAVTITYTAVGGLKIDIITDAIQSVIIFGVFIMLAILTWTKGWTPAALASAVPSSHWNLFAFGGVAWSVGAVVLGGLIYLGNTSYWQRIFSARDEQTARRSFLYALPLLALAAFMMIYLGFVATASATVGDQALFVVMAQHLPPVLLGLGYAAILAVVMSTVDSLLVAGTAVMHRFVKGGLGRARLTTAVMGMLGFGLAFLVPDIVALSLLTSYLVLVFAPPLLAILFRKRISRHAIFASLAVPTLVVVSLFWFLPTTVFLISTGLGVLIVLGYDSVFVNAHRG